MVGRRRIHIKNIKNTPSCDCPFCTRRRQIIEQQGRSSLANVKNQIEQSRQRREEYEKTAKLLRLVNKDPIGLLRLVNNV